MIGRRVSWHETDEKKLAAVTRRLEMDRQYRESMRYQDPPDCSKVCKGCLLKLAYQPEQWVGGTGSRGFVREKVVSARWVALVLRDDSGELIEMDPKQLRSGEIDL